jgi:Trk-type K+ transport system membrane component
LTVVLTGLMWLGRVELFAVLILVLPKTWRR